MNVQKIVSKMVNVLDVTKMKVIIEKWKTQSKIIIITLIQIILNVIKALLNIILIKISPHIKDVMNHVKPVIKMEHMKYIIV